MFSLDELEEKARLMRQAPTTCESRAMDSFPNAWQVQRQVVFGFYILDFVVPARLLVIEIDGQSHSSQVAHDARRDAFCLEHGLRVLRIPNHLAHVAGQLAAGYPLIEEGAKGWLKALSKARSRQSHIEEKHRSTPAERRAQRKESQAARDARRAAALQEFKAGLLPPWDAPAERVVLPPAPGSFMNQPKSKDTPAQKAERQAIKKARREAGKAKGMAARIAEVAARTEW